MSTFLQTVNAVLTKLREPEVSSITDDYTRLIARFVNEAKEEVEDAWNWTALRSTATVSAVSTATIYSVTGTFSRTRVNSAWNTTKKRELNAVGSYANTKKYETYGTVSGPVTDYDVYGTDSTTGALKVRTWPTPDSSQTLTFYLINPQGELSTSTDLSTEIKVPSNPVIQLAYALAIKERGEDKGQLSPFQDESYFRALNKAVAQDEAFHGDETTWQPI